MSARMEIDPSITVAAVMTPDPVTVRPSDRLSVAAELMEKRGIQHFPVTDEAGRLVAMLSERNLRDAMPSILTLKDAESRQRSLALTRVEQVATVRPVSVTPTSSVAEAIGTMRRLRVGSLPVVEGDRLVGILTTGDLLNLLAVALGTT